MQEQMEAGKTPAGKDINRKTPAANGTSGRLPGRYLFNMEPSDIHIRHVCPHGCLKLQPQALKRIPDHCRDCCLQPRVDIAGE